MGGGRWEVGGGRGEVGGGRWEVGGGNVYFEHSFYGKKSEWIIFFLMIACVRERLCES